MVHNCDKNMVCSLYFSFLYHFKFHLLLLFASHPPLIKFFHTSFRFLSNVRLHYLSLSAASFLCCFLSDFSLFHFYYSVVNLFFLPWNIYFGLVGGLEAFCFFHLSIHCLFPSHRHSCFPVFQWITLHAVICMQARMLKDGQ